MCLFKLAFALLCLSQIVAAQEPIDEKDVYDAIDIHPLVFVYTRSDLLKRKPTPLEDAANVDVVLNASVPDRQTSELMFWALTAEHDLHVRELKLSSLEDDNFIWSVLSSLHPSPDSGIIATTGIPYHYCAYLTGRGDLINPKPYLWSTWQLSDNQYLRCALALSDCRLKDEQKPRHGDEIMQLATRRLAEFMQDQTTKLGADVKIEDLPKWRYHSQRLVENFPDDFKIWSVNFIDEKTVDVDHPLNERPEFQVWVTEDGRIGALSIGPESLNPRFRR